MRPILAAILIWAAPLGAAPALQLSLGQSVAKAQGASSALRAARHDADAADAKVRAARAVLLPRISLDGSYRWVKEIPSIKLSPMAPPAQFGDHHNYSVGLGAQWDLFGSLGSWRQLQALQAAAEAKRQEAGFQERALLLRTRLAYFQVQLAATKLRLLAQSLGLAQSQDSDLQLRLKAGTSSRIDALSASNEELDRRAQFRLAQAELAGALRELFALSGDGEGADLRLPMADLQGQSLPARVDEASLVLSLDDPEALLNALKAAGEAPFDAAKHPRLDSMRALVEAARRQADAAYARHWPSGSVGVKQSLDYPNGPVLEQVNQTQVTAGMSIPLFSFGAVSAQVDEGVALAQAAQERRTGAETELRRDWAKSRDRLAALQSQLPLLEQRAAQAQSLQDLVYKAYKIGGANFLEVQSTGLRSLQAGLELALSKTQMLIELATLSALTE